MNSTTGVKIYTRPNIQVCNYKMMKSLYIILILLTFSIKSEVQEKETDDFLPPETLVEIKATKTNSKIDEKELLSWKFTPLSFSIWGLTILK